MCVDNFLQPEPRKRWTIDKIVDSEWIKMNQKLVKMNEQESLALVEALKRVNATENQKHLKKIEAKKSNTQQILKTQRPRFMSTTQQIDSTFSSNLGNNTESNKSIDNLRRSVRVINAGNLYASSSNNNQR